MFSFISLEIQLGFPKCNRKMTLAKKTWEMAVVVFTRTVPKKSVKSQRHKILNISCCHFAIFLNLYSHLLKNQSLNSNLKNSYFWISFIWQNSHFFEFAKIIIGVDRVKGFHLFFAFRSVISKVRTHQSWATHRSKSKANPPFKLYQPSSRQEKDSQPRCERIRTAKVRLHSTRNP